jgi:hypothetical protein
MTTPDHRMGASTELLLPVTSASSALARVRDACVIAACLCVVLLTVTLAVLYVRVGDAVDRIAPSEPAPVVECVGELPC